jgi:hypothetical protein
MSSGDAQVAVDPNGVVTAVWSQGGNIWANRYTPGVGWGSAEPIGDIGSFPQVVVDPDAYVTAVWAGQFNRYTPGLGWAVPRPSPTGFAPQVAVEANGHVTAVWSQGGNIWSSRFE